MSIEDDLKKRGAEALAAYEVFGSDGLKGVSLNVLGLLASEIGGLARPFWEGACFEDPLDEKASKMRQDIAQEMRSRDRARGR